MAVPDVEGSPAAVRRPDRSSVTATDWVDAAAAVFADRGLTAMRVEALARDLGVTKGSFYWHFADRHALVAAVVDRWETEHTEAMIDESSQGDTPADQLHRLVVAVSSRVGESRGLQLLYVEAEREGVREAVDRVTSRRIDFLAGLLVELGQDREEAERRSVLALSSSLGMQQLLTGAPQALRRESLDRERLTAFLYATLLG